jgi:outer membrane lipoprotein-sorting protein
MIKFHSTAIALLILATTAQGQDLTVDEIVQRTNHTSYYQGQDGKARVSMTITDEQGRTREREFTILRSNMDDEDKEQRFYVYFHRPADIREMVFLVWKHVGADDDRWLYLPALDVVKRIAASDERTSFVGSHFYYEDVSGRGLDKDAHELVETTDDYYVLKNTPKDPDSVEFDSFTMWIHKATFIPVKVEYEKGGEVYRIVEALKVEEIQGHKTVTKSRMKDLKSGGETILEYSTVQYDNDLPEDIFTERYLRRAPGKYIR